MDKIQEYGDLLVEGTIHFIPKLIIAGLLLWIGMKSIKKLVSIISMAMVKAKLSDDLKPFLLSIIDISFKAIILFIAASIIGIQTASFVAVLAAAGFAIGMSLQGTLGNFAAGIILLIFKPYKVGEWVEIQEKFGRVEEIHIFHTTIVTPGRKTLIIPNGGIISGVITNFSAKGYIRMELKVTMPYSEDFPRIKSVILKSLDEIPDILKDPAPEIGIDGFESHSITISVRPYAKPDDYWDVYFMSYERIKAAFHDNNIKVAYSEGVEMGEIGA